MAQTREIKKRIGGVRTVQRITKTMQMIATAKFTAALQRAQATRPYAGRIGQLVGEALAGVADFEHRLIDGPAESAGRRRVLVITSDRGMCGAYNGNLLRAAMGQIRQIRSDGAELDLEAVGKKAMAYFKFQKIHVSRSHGLGDRPSFDDVGRVAQQYIDEFMEGRLDAVHVAYTDYISNARQVPKVVQLLPLQPVAGDDDAAAAAKAVYEFSPSPEEILGDLMPLAVKTTLYSAVLSAVVSEQIMRMVAMKAATENAKELGRTLTRRYNRARQSQITTELMEIIAGAAALE